MKVLEKVKNFFKKSVKQQEKKEGCTRAKCLCKEQGITNITFLKSCNHYGKIN